MTCINSRDSFKISLPAPFDREGGDHHLGEREGEVFSDLTRRAISISSSEGLPSTGVYSTVLV